MMMVSKHPILVHAVFDLQIRLPDPINGKSTINFEALSHWCHPDITPGCYDTGFSFNSPPEEIEELVDKIAEYFTFNLDTLQLGQDNPDNNSGENNKDQQQ